jgi:hypothetical protein
MSKSLLTDVITALPQVERVSAWSDRHYVNLKASRGSRDNGDLRTKIWFKGSELTIESGKGYFSSAFNDAKAALIAAVETAGGCVRSI